MKYCSRPYNYLYIDNDFGDIMLCPWMEPGTTLIGNLVQSQIEDCYNSNKANELRASIEDQSFCFCRNVACPHLQNNDLEEISYEEYQLRKKELYSPTVINMAYDFVCNQHCTTCRNEIFAPPSGYNIRMKTIQKRLAPYLDNATEISASGHGDPFASKYMMDVLENIHPRNPNLVILLETNGVFFDEVHWKRLEHLKQCFLNIVLTSNSLDEFTYNHISLGGNYKKLLHNLSFLSDLRRQNYIKVFSHSFVIQDRNFREIPSFIDRSFRDYAFDNVILKPVYQWGTMPDDVFWFKDVLNPLHPYHQEYLEILQHPSLKDPRVYNFGGETEHPASPFPGTSGNCTAEQADNICQQEQTIQEQQQCIESQEMLLNDIEARYSCQKQKIMDLSNQIEYELTDVNKQLTDIQNSHSFKIGRAFTALPRKIRDSLK